MSEPTYFVVYSFDGVLQDFCPVGIYTQESDANAHNERLGPTSTHTVAPRTHKQLCAELANQFLGKLADPLRVFLSEHPDIGPKFKAIYGEHELPLAVACVKEA